METGPESSAAEYLAGAMDAAKRGAALTQQLLAFARKKMVRPEVLDINEVLQRMGTMIRRLVGENLELVAVAVTVARQGQGRRRQPGTGDHEPGGQRARRGGRVGTHHAGDAQRVARRRLLPHARRDQSRRVRGADGDRHRRGHDARGAGARVRAVLHHQTDGRGDGPGPGDVPRHRQAGGRQHLVHQRARPGQHVSRLFSAHDRGDAAAADLRSGRRRRPRRRRPATRRCCWSRTRRRSCASRARR